VKKETADNLISDIENNINVGFLSVDNESLAKACKKFLIHMGYKVIDPIKYTYPNIEKLDDLFYLFYALLEYNHPELVDAHRNMNRDRALAKRFLDSRMDAGNLNKKQALCECAEIINTVFDREDDFNFNLPLSFEMFGQQSAGWITKKAVDIMNSEKEKRDIKIVEGLQDKYIEEYLKEYGEEDIGFDVDEILENIDKEKV
jgi:hypothetical protein